MQYNYKNKVAFITGASNGIGRATAKAFHLCGASVMLADVDVERGEALAKEINGSGGKALFTQCDVIFEDDIKFAIKETERQFGRLDFAFNNAGVEGTPTSTSEITEDEWNRVVNINLRSVFFGLKYQIPLMRRQGSGAIVNCSSIAGHRGFANLAPYVASKHGVIGLTKNAALEEATSNIRINVVCPGVIETPMVERFTKGNADALTQLIQQEPMGRMGTPEEVAAAVLWLCSDQSSFVTGHALNVDGGWLAR